MNKYLKLIIFVILLSASFVFSRGVEAAAPGGAYISTYTYTDTITTTASCSWDSYKNIYACLGAGGPWCVPGSSVAGYPSCSSCGGQGGYYAQLRKSSCKSIYWCTNLPWYSPGTETVTTTVTKTGYRCNYVSSVNSWGTCSYASGTQNATDVNWSSWDSTSPIGSCSNSVALTRICGVCHNDTISYTYPTLADLNVAPLVGQTCQWGSRTSVSYDKFSGLWNWYCTRGGVSSGLCTAKNSFIDIGLRIQDSNTPGGVIKVAAEEETCYSPYRIYKNWGGKTVWCLGITDTSGIYANSNAKIMTSDGVKDIMRLP